jgi:hypothetical protein
VAGESAAKALGDMASGESKTVSWTLRSDTAGDSTINVTANGTDENTGQDVLGVTTVSASITVEQASQLPWWLIPIFVGFLLFAAVVWVAWRRVRS